VKSDQRADYVRDLHACINARSVWLFRDFLERYEPILGKLSSLAIAKSNEQLNHLLEDIESAFEGRSENQVATQLCAPWLLSREVLNS
jgi:hypothetical protein